MIPFRELEVFNAFVFDGRECEKMSERKYLIYDEHGDPESLEVADPNMMVEFAEEGWINNDNLQENTMDIEESEIRELVNESKLETTNLTEEEEEDDDESLQNYFFSTLLRMIEAIERSGDKVTLKDLKKLAIASLKMGGDP
jgi:hypothetical protein